MSLAKRTQIDAVLSLLKRTDARTKEMLSDEPIRVATEKVLFFTTPAEYRGLAEDLRVAIQAAFGGAEHALQERLLTFALDWADSLNSPVELHHNLASTSLHGDLVLTDAEVATEREKAATLVYRLGAAAPKVERKALDWKRTYTDNINSSKRLNLFKAWAERWQERTGQDPFGSSKAYLSHRAELFQRGNYYVDLYFARAEGETITQFFNDYGEQAEDCRKIGSLGGTTNPAIATLGEDDVPRKWAEARRKVAEKQLAEGHDDDWGASAFTEYVVVNAMLGQRPVFLLEGLGRIAYQLRPDKHDDLSHLLETGPEIYRRLSARMAVFDEILLEGADPKYREIAGERVGKANNHFKVSVAGPVALKVLREFNAGNNKYSERLYTNATVTHDVPQICAALDALQEGMAEWERKTGKQCVEEASGGHQGSVITSMMGRFGDAKRQDRLDALTKALESGGPPRELLEAARDKKLLLTDPTVNSAEVIASLRVRGVEFRPKEEEDAIVNFATLVTKVAVNYAVSKYGAVRGNRILSASKRFFGQNLDLENAHRYSTDFGDVQAGSLDAKYELRVEPLAGLDPETGLPTESAGGVWWNRLQVLRRIFPDADKLLTPGGIAPEDYLKQRYNQATLGDFIGKWRLNVARAGLSAKLLREGRGDETWQREFAEGFFGHLKDREERAAEFLAAF